MIRNVKRNILNNLRISKIGKKENTSITCMHKTQAFIYFGHCFIFFFLDGICCKGAKQIRWLVFEIPQNKHYLKFPNVLTGLVCMLLTGGIILLLRFFLFFYKKLNYSVTYISCSWVCEPLIHLAPLYWTCHWLFLLWQQTPSQPSWCRSSQKVLLN